MSHGGTGDEGKISFEDDGNQLLDVRYVEFQSGFMGGCNGLWTRKGKVEDLMNLNLELEGENCEYSSSNVRLEFKRY